VDELIDGACCGVEVKREKPYTDAVRVTVEKLGLRASQVMLVGDTL